MTRVPRTTLASIDCVLPSLAARALALSMRQCDYEQVKLLTDAPAGTIAGLDPRILVVPIARLDSRRGYSRFVMKELVSHVDTDFVQLVQWDGYVARGDSWDDAFLDYDYIGARWFFHPPGRDVGNGGFSLRSRRLLDALAGDGIEVGDVEDEAICRTHRDVLERRHGIRFAPGAVADRYAVESTIPNGREFGFHGVFNLPRFLGEAELAEVLDPIPDAVFCGPGSVTLVVGLAAARRHREALKYAKRLRAQRYANIGPDFREPLARTLSMLVGRMQPCPCGSGLAYRRCCGALEAWQD